MESYVGAARLLFHLPGGVDDGTCQFVKPLSLIFPGLFEMVTSFPAKYGFTIQNILYYFSASLLAYKIALILFKNHQRALIASIAYSSASPIIVHSLGYQTDMPGWFFGILGIYLVLKNINFTHASKWMYIGIIMGLGFLHKESAIVGPVFLGVFVLLCKLKFSAKAKIITVGALGFLIPVLISGIIVYKLFGYTSIDWLINNHQSTGGELYDLRVYFIQAFRTLDMYWYLFLIGCAVIIKAYKKNEITLQVRNYLAATGVTVLLWPIWPYPAERMFYLSAPFFMIIISIGAGYVKNYQVFTVILAAILNFLLVYLGYKYMMNNILYYSSIIFCVTLMIFFICSRGKVAA